MTKQAIIVASILSLLSMSSVFAENSVKSSPIAQVESVAKTAVNNATSDVKKIAQDTNNKATNAAADVTKTAQDANNKATNATADVKNNIKQFAPDAQQNSVHKNCVGNDCKNENCKGNDCKQANCTGNDCKNENCKGNDCKQANCTGNDCKKENCKGNDCKHVNCSGNDCKHSDKNQKADASEQEQASNEETGTVATTQPEAQMGLMDKIMSFFKN